MIYSVSWVWILAFALVVAAIAGGVTWIFVDHDDAAPPVGLAAATVGLLAFAVPMAIRESHAYEVWCVAQGGHTDSHTDTTVVPVINGDGSVGVGTSSSTTTYCLTADGRIIDVN